MEHRQGIRKLVNIATVAELSSGETLPARIKDVSFCGVYVELPSEPLWSHAPLKLTFSLPQIHGNTIYHWRGFVTRITDEGVGAMFESADPTEQAGLLALLKQADTQYLPTALAS